MAEKPTLSGLSLKPETQEQVEQAMAAMRHAGLTPPEHVAMMLEVIGRESEKRLEERAELEKLFANSPVMRSAIKIQPFQAGTDFEFVIPVADAGSKEKALQA